VAFCSFLAQFLYHSEKKLTNILREIWMEFEREKACIICWVFSGFKEIVQNNRLPLPKVNGSQLGVVQFFLLLVCPSLTHVEFCHPCDYFAIFRWPTDPRSVEYNNAADSVGNYLGTYWIRLPCLCFKFSTISPVGSKSNRKLVHNAKFASLEEAGFILIYFITEPWLLFIFVFL